MPERTKGWVIVSGEEEYLLVDEGGVARKVTAFEEIYDIVTRCPRCGARATAVALHRLKHKGRFVGERVYEYYYLSHSANGARHAWFLGPRTPLTEKIAERVGAGRRRTAEERLPDEEKRLLYRVFIKKKGYTKEEAEQARRILRRFIGLEE
jgi:hypothetical protein